MIIKASDPYEFSQECGFFERELSLYLKKIMAETIIYPSTSIPDVEPGRDDYQNLMYGGEGYFV